MKNLAKNAGLLFVAVAAVLSTSCTKQDEIPNSKAVETNKVSFVVDAKGNETGKVVDRNAAPLYVDNVTITGTCNGYGFPYVATDSFTFGAAGTGVQSGFSLDNVALGINTFTATSGSAAANKQLHFVTPILANPGQDGLEALKAHTPYITCTSNSATATIVKGTNAPIALNMTTTNGRVLAKFVKETTLADDYLVKITATQGNFTQIESLITDVAGPKYFEWSNENAIEGATITFTIKIYEKANTSNGEGALLNTIVKTVTVHSATNTLATYTIHNSDVQENIVNGGITLTFPTMTDVIIND